MSTEQKVAKSKPAFAENRERSVCSNSGLADSVCCLVREHMATANSTPRKGGTSVCSTNYKRDGRKDESELADKDLHKA